MTLTQLQSAVRAIAGNPELVRNVADLWGQLASGELSPDERELTISVLADGLWSSQDVSPLGGDTSFGERLQAAMAARSVSQVELAEKLGVGQPAISMLLKRTSRPQRNTVRRIAAALGVGADELWPAQS